MLPLSTTIRVYIWSLAIHHQFDFFSSFFFSIHRSVTLFNTIAIPLSFTKANAKNLFTFSTTFFNLSTTSIPFTFNLSSKCSSTFSPLLLPPWLPSQLLLSKCLSLTSRNLLQRSMLMILIGPSLFTLAQAPPLQAMLHPLVPPLESPLASLHPTQAVLLPPAVLLPQPLPLESLLLLPEPAPQLLSLVPLVTLKFPPSEWLLLEPLLF
ncbi:hypothetical protein EYC84_007237 [Monilinia fructicola]|uniref:Uncharacterized protein n=1 Tax=Monilinia fructicola TaxID=38448 RepID=A0A5M9K8P8_MONFR|nr:hypothetical protein EYC84_007237 [Monilinia fructicola]